MNITAIQTFLTVVRIGNLNRAASELNITQSAVTARLDALDQALGERLLNRSRKGTTLTKAGYAFLEQAEVIVRMWDTAKARLSLPQGVKSLFSLVCDPSLWDSAGKAWMNTLRTTYTDTAFEVWATRGQEAQDWLTSGISDAAILPAPLSGPGIATRVFKEDRLVQCGTQPRACIAWDPAYVYVDYGPKFRIQHAETWPGNETANMSFSNPEWALAHILEHGGSAYLPISIAAEPIAQGTLHKITGSPTFDHKTYLSWRVGCEEHFKWLSHSE